MAARAAVQERHAPQQEQRDDRHDDDDDDEVRDRRQVIQLPPGQYVTPTAMEGSAARYLNPGLSGYPGFLAGEAVKSQLSQTGAH